MPRIMWTPTPYSKTTGFNMLLHSSVIYWSRHMWCQHLTLKHFALFGNFSCIICKHRCWKMRLDAQSEVNVQPPLFWSLEFGHCGNRHLGFIKSEVTIFGQEGGAITTWTHPPINSPVFIIYFTLNVTLIYKMSITPCWRRLKTRE